MWNHKINFMDVESTMVVIRGWRELRGEIVGKN